MMNRCDSKCIHRLRRRRHGGVLGMCLLVGVGTAPYPASAQQLPPPPGSYPVTMPLTVTRAATDRGTQPPAPTALRPGMLIPEAGPTPYGAGELGTTLFGATQPPAAPQHAREQSQTAPAMSRMPYERPPARSDFSVDFSRPARPRSPAYDTGPGGSDVYPAFPPPATYAGAPVAPARPAPLQQPRLDPLPDMSFRNPSQQPVTQPFAPSTTTMPGVNARQDVPAHDTTSYDPLFRPPELQPSR